MIHQYEYSVIDEVHCYTFLSIPLKLTLTPSYFITADFDKELNVLCIDLIRYGNKGNYNVGKTVCYILNNFINNNPNYALGYYPSSTDDKEIARVKLFNRWANSFVTNDITSYKNVLRFLTEDNNKEELVIQVFTHKDFQKSNQLLLELNNFSASIANK